MQQTVHQSGVTFAVDEVIPATEPLPECRTHQSALLCGVESCCDYHGTVLKDVRYHPLLAAVHTAFSQHRPLVLTPDAVWLTIAQGVAQHMTIHGERLRSRLVAHQGKLDLVFECQDWVEGSPENPWPEAFAAWTGQIRDHVGPAVHDTLVCDFSTTGPVERAASHVVMMDVFERYFHYEAVCICGIPMVTLEGTPADWQRLADKAAALSVFDLDWWLERLLPVCGQLVRASRGDVDREHWRNICKLRHAYGGDVINGWVATFFPYVRSFIYGPCNKRNPLFETGAGFSTLDAPSGLSVVPFTWRNAATGRERRMDAIGGLVGVTQDPQTLALRPRAGWAVCLAPKLDVLLARLKAEHTTFPPGGRVLPPRDMATFYHQTGGAELFGRGETAAYRIVAAEQVEGLDWGETPDGFGVNTRGPDGRTWYRFAWLADGSWLAINLDANRRDPRPRDPRNWRYDELFHAICHGHTNTEGQPGQNPVIALSFTELLERLLDSGGRPYWLEAQFAGYGDAELYTRRG
jgi:hypothetical protein